MTRVLIVDDEPAIRMTIATLLRLEGFEVETAADGQEALERAQQNIPDLLISDLQMPRMGGLPLLQALRTQPSLQKVRTIVLAGWEENDHGAQQAHALSNYCMKKPFSRCELLAALAHLGITR